MKILWSFKPTVKIYIMWFAYQILTCILVVETCKISSKIVDMTWYFESGWQNFFHEFLASAYHWYALINLPSPFKAICMKLLNMSPLIEWRPWDWWQSKSALDQHRDILFYRMASTLFMSQFTLVSLDFWVKFTSWEIMCSA